MTAIPNVTNTLTSDASTFRVRLMSLLLSVDNASSLRVYRKFKRYFATAPSGMNPWAAEATRIPPACQYGPNLAKLQIVANETQRAPQ